MSTTPSCTTTEMMTVAAARRLQNGVVCFVGIGLPSTAANLARLTHAPDIVLIYESGPIGAKPSVLPLSIGDGELAETADTVVSTAEIFRYWLQGSRIDVGFLGAAQVDRFGNINTTVIGPYDHPVVRLPGAGGASEIASLAREVLIVLQQSKRTFVEKVDFITSAGYLDGGDTRAKLNLPGKGPVAIITDLCIMEPEAGSCEFVVTHLHPGVTREKVIENTGWTIRFAEKVDETDTPSEAELIGASCTVATHGRSARKNVMSKITRAYGPVTPGTQPPHLYPAYVSTRKRAPSKPLVLAPQTLSELTGPVFGRDIIGPLDHDLTRQHARRAARRAHHRRPAACWMRTAGRFATRSWSCGRRMRLDDTHTRSTRHDAPLDPNFSRMRPDDDRRGRPIPLRHRQARRLSVDATITTPGVRRTFIFQSLARRFSRGW